MRAQVSSQLIDEVSPMVWLPPVDARGQALYVEDDVDRADDQL